jgi:tryptophan synthase alpha subunit
VTTGVERIAAAFSGHGRAAALMPYLMGGYPDIASSIECGLAAADAGADLIELGVPFSDPLADGPVIHSAGTAALRGGVHVHDVLGVAREISPQVPVVLMVYSNPILKRGAERFTDEAAAAGAAGLIVPDLPFDEADAVRSWSRPPRPPSGRPRSAATPAASSTRSQCPARRASGTRWRPSSRTPSPVSARPPTFPSRSDSASRRRSTPAMSARSRTA